jgi:hypothetical protein
MNKKNHQGEHDVEHMRRMFHNRQLRVDPRDIEFLVTLVKEEAHIQLLTDQVCGILDLYPQAHVMLGIHGVDTEPMRFVMDAVSLFFVGRTWPLWEEIDHGVPGQEHLIDMDRFRDQIKTNAIKMGFIQG